MNDTLIISFISYKSKEVHLSNIDVTKEIFITLEEKSQAIKQVVIIRQDPISEQFAVEKMNKIDIYLNPVSQADPLKAITILPASTNTDETANPSLRGSSSIRSRVVLNGVPIYNPVRFNQMNNQGIFSLFNNEIISEQYVYSSNPPLTYGNTSAGLVEINTIKRLNYNQLQLSTSLANMGFFLSHRIKKNRTFIQVYGNYQFSDAFVNIQKNYQPNIKNFYTKDIGINFHAQMGKNSEFNSYNYYIYETFNGFSDRFNYRGDVYTSNKRYFTVNNFKYYKWKGVLSINNAASFSKQNIIYGNIDHNPKIYQVYSSIDYRQQLHDNMNLQFGVSYDYHQNKYCDSISSYFYTVSPNSPNFYFETSISNNIFEAYIYAKWDVYKNLLLSSGLRTNIPFDDQNLYLSSQFS